MSVFAQFDIILHAGVMRRTKILSSPSPVFGRGGRGVRATLIRITLMVVAISLSSFAAIAGSKPVPRMLDFDCQVRPILAEKCFTCHGFDAGKRQSGLRLDTAEGAWMKLASGRIAVVPHDLKASEIIERISTTSPLQMPPVSSQKKISTEQIAILKRWVEEGGKYAKHWAFIKPVRPAVPRVKNIVWPQNPIDNFILARLEKEGLKPSPEADKATLIRRLSLDLTGIPPTLAEVNAFISDKNPKAYENTVDRLIASPHYGERMALPWLDLARYADTHGYHIDSQRDMWRWRDWVIDAYNNNMPYNQFTLEQLAGDMLPNATLSQKIATGFNRNHPITFEGGVIPEEYAAAYIEDRIDTTSTAFMGLTMRCSQCHDHKYDPISQKEYYKFFAFFNNIPEKGSDGNTGNAVPYIKAPLPGQQEELDKAEKALADAKNQLKSRVAESAPAVIAWEKTAITTLSQSTNLNKSLEAHFPLDETSGSQVTDSTGKIAGTIKGKATHTHGKIGSALEFDGKTYVDLGNSFRLERSEKFSAGAWVNPTGGNAYSVLGSMDEDNMFRGWDLYLDGGGKVFLHLINTWDKNAVRVNTKDAVEMNKWSHILVTYDGSSKGKGIKIFINGVQKDIQITHDTLTGSIATDTPLHIGQRKRGAPFEGIIDEIRLYRRELGTTEVAQLVGVDSLLPILAVAPEKRTPDQTASLSNYYLENEDKNYRSLSITVTDLQKKRNDVDNAIVTTMVMEEMPKPRTTHVLLRGEYDKIGEVVTADTPQSLPPIPADLPHNRLGLAKWLIGPMHPLTARVAVNRYWQMYFGLGIVKTSENFGIQGDRPSHPELLDWLATEFVRTGWDVKKMQKLIVMSEAYRQSSHVNPSELEKDPENRLLAHAPRVRLPAEFIRDQALASGGLLVDHIGGPSVKPYQTPGIWEELAISGGNSEFSAQRYVQDHGDKLYRRSMYTFWKRTVPPPSLQTFDAPEREFCMVRRSVTNTPLQALVLMNDPVYIESARKFAERIMTEGGFWPAERIRYTFRTVLARSPKPAEFKVLQEMFDKELVHFRLNRAAAEKLLSVGESSRNKNLDETELAAWTSMASIILNLDESITRS